VVGDLNVTPWNAAFRHLQRDGGLVSSQHGFGLQPTWPTAASLAPWPPVPGLPAPLRVPIDHLLHTPDLVAVDRRLGPSLGSTHRALEVELAPRRAPGAG
jgi:endonuclease/exonuclease/phosphatase (EEP) superfamily protein YafD